MIVNRLFMRNRMQLYRSNCIASQQVRAFGGGGGDPNHKYEYVDTVDAAGNRTKLKIPSKHDVEFQNPLKGTRNEWMHMWLHGRWDPTQDEKLDNSKVNKFSMYYLFGSNPL